jgi:hypothetical protein
MSSRTTTLSLIVSSSSKLPRRQCIFNYKLWGVFSFLNINSACFCIWIHVLIIVVYALNANQFESFYPLRWFQELNSRLKGSTTSQNTCNSLHSGTIERNGPIYRYIICLWSFWNIFTWTYIYKNKFIEKSYILPENHWLISIQKRIATS